MKKVIFTLMLIIFSTNLFCQEKEKIIANKWSAEGIFGAGYEFECSNIGIEYGLRANYFLLDRFGFYTSIGSFQSLGGSKYSGKSHYSNFLWNLNVFGDVLKTKKGHRLRLSAGATYFNGALVYDELAVWYGDGSYEALRQKAIYYNNIGVNFGLSYICPLTEKWNLGVNLKAYDIIDGMFMQIVTLGISASYNF